MNQADDEAKIGSNLDEELEVDIVGFGSGAPRLLAPAPGDEIDTLQMVQNE